MVLIHYVLLTKFYPKSLEFWAPPISRVEERLRGVRQDNDKGGLSSGDRQ
jgi:pyridoxine/pyridoxamine 5'-phosphate oxidase